MAPAAMDAAQPAETVAAITVPNIIPDKYPKDQHGRVQHIEGFFDCPPGEVHPWQRYSRNMAQV